MRNCQLPPSPRILSFVVLSLIGSLGSVDAKSPAEMSAEASIGYLGKVMDEFHKDFIVYEDLSSPGNHFTCFAKIPSEEAPVELDTSWAANKHSGANSIRCELIDQAGDPRFGGFIFLNGKLEGTDRKPNPVFGQTPGAGVDLTGAIALTFRAKGAKGGERVDFLFGGVGHSPKAKYPDSCPPLKIETSLSTTWRKFTVDLRGRNLSFIQGGFGWIASLEGPRGNPDGAVFFVDDIRIKLGPEAREKRLNQPRFLRSFTPTDRHPDIHNNYTADDIDLVMRNAASTYDNALALLAFLADGSPDSLRRARLIGDAFIRAQKHDRFAGFNDGRLRSFYAAGDISLPPAWKPNGVPGTVPIPGFYDIVEDKFFEVEQGSLDTGNNAWAMISLIALGEKTGESKYTNAAKKVGRFIREFRDDDPSHTYRGFYGGIDKPEKPLKTTLRKWASSEHNIDVFAAFSEMFCLTSDPEWKSGAKHAGEFVETMWDVDLGSYLTGTSGPDERNATEMQLPLDVQAWSVLAFKNALTMHPDVLAAAEKHHRVDADGLTGFDFNNDKDGIWFEGTAQMAVAYAISGMDAKATELRASLRKAQDTLEPQTGGGLVATNRNSLSTGFTTSKKDPFNYYRRPHVGATAWNVFAQLGVNPYYLP